MLGVDVVKDALETLFLAVTDLVKNDRDVDLAWGFANVRCTHRNLSTVFSADLTKTLGNAQFENQMIRQRSPVSTLWTTSYNQTWANSTLGSLVKKPNETVTNTLNEKTAALKIMSLDLSSSGRFFNPPKN